MSKAFEKDLKTLYKLSVEHKDLQTQQAVLENQQAQLDKQFAVVEKKNIALNKKVKPLITRLAKSGKNL